jgi:ATP-binding cassette subfamily B protein
VDRFGENALRFRNAFVRQGDIEARFLPLLLLGLAEAGGFLHAILLYRQDLISLGGVVAYFGLLQLFGFPTFVSIFAYSQISLGIAGARRILDLINRETNLDQNTAGHASQMQGAVEFRNVTFAYNGSEPALEAVSSASDLPTVAVVG